MQRAKTFKLLHLDSDPIVERSTDLHIGARGTFEKLLADGDLLDYEAIHFLAEYRRTHDAASVCANILERAAAVRPDIVYWQHISEFPVSQRFIDDLRAVSQHGLLVYHDADAFGYIKKRITPQMRLMLANADVTFVSGLGELTSIFRAAGARDLRYMPQSFDPRRFGQPWDFSLRRKHKAVMVASNYPGRIPGIYIPGGRKRAALARKLSAIHGSGFALYGSGWRNLVSARGVVHFDSQEAVIRDAWVSVNWDHFDTYAFYYSNRLPISLAAGVPHVTTYHPGYEDLFADCPGLYFAHSVDEAVAMVDWLLSKTCEQLVEEGRAAQEWAKTRLSSDITYRHMLEICVEKSADRAA